MAAAAAQQSSQLETIPAETAKKIVPILLEIERKGYKPDSDELYRYTFLAQMLVTGTARADLVNKKLSQMYRVFEIQHGKREALALMIFLFKSCGDSTSIERLEALVYTSGHYQVPLFAGKRVNEEEREKFNFRNLIVHITDELEESKRDDLVTILQSETEEDGDPTLRTNYKKILELMVKACYSGVLSTQNPSAKLLEWLRQLGFIEGGALSVMKEIANYDSKKQFPGCGLDSMEY